MESVKKRLLNTISHIQDHDSKLAEELHEVRGQHDIKEKATEFEGFFDDDRETKESLGPAGLKANLGLETIVLRVGRPVLKIANDEAILHFNDVESQVWKGRLEAAKQHLVNATQAVGRIELQNEPSFEWVGTGWLVNETIVVTNRHVAEVFGRRKGSQFVFRQGLRNRNIDVFVDFLEEAGRADELTFKIVSIIHIEEDEGPDIALLRVELSDKNKLAEPIKLSAFQPKMNQQVAVIGYPARDSRIPDQQLMLNIFGDIYNKKRLAPGQVIGSSATELLHDCSTLGGNSGSVVLDLDSGEALGLHFAGRFLESNFAVPAAVINDRVQRFGEKRPGTVHPISRPEPSIKVETQSNNIATFTIPLTISVSIDGATLNNKAVQLQQSVQMNQSDDIDEILIEATPEDYANREGFDEFFLGKDIKVPLPQIVDEKLKGSVLSFSNNGDTHEELNYEHFSVVMNKDRRMCFYSAVNIDGNTSVPMKRGPWRLDPRIPKESQIIKECYGNTPKFSRGHMTRRLDPIWGESKEAMLGNADSMHATNVVPQMQDMNSGVWLKLENYALHNARKDDMHISVFTGPVFDDGDPVKFGVTIPLAFWKVIAFIHDKTKRLCATGYRISQVDFLKEEEFVFGEHETFQVPIAAIEKETGLSFGMLTELDPLGKEIEGLATATRKLAHLDQIRFLN